MIWRSVVLSGDTGPSENLIRFSQGVDLLIHEVRLAGPGADGELMSLEFGSHIAPCNRQTRQYIYYQQLTKLFQISHSDGGDHIFMQEFLAPRYEAKKIFLVLLEHFPY